MDSSQLESSKYKNNMKNRISIHFSISLKAVNCKSVITRPSLEDTTKLLINSGHQNEILFDTKIGIREGDRTSQSNCNETITLNFTADGKPKGWEHEELNKIMRMFVDGISSQRERLRKSHFYDSDNNPIVSGKSKIPLWDIYCAAKSDFLKEIRPLEKERRIAISKRNFLKASNLSQKIAEIKQRKGISESMFVIKVTMHATQIVLSSDEKFLYNISNNSNIIRVKGQKHNFIFPIGSMVEYDQTMTEIKKQLSLIDAEIRLQYSEEELISFKNENSNNDSDSSNETTDKSFNLSNHDREIKDQAEKVLKEVDYTIRLRRPPEDNLDSPDDYGD